MNALERWFLKPAAWWQFWLPQSGAPGGLIVGAILWIPTLAWMALR